MTQMQEFRIQGCPTKVLYFINKNLIEGTCSQGKGTAGTQETLRSQNHRKMDSKKRQTSKAKRERQDLNKPKSKRNASAKDQRDEQGEVKQSSTEDRQTFKVNQEVS